jgi:hypothetical protein
MHGRKRDCIHANIYIRRVVHRLLFVTLLLSAYKLEQRKRELGKKHRPTVSLTRPSSGVTSRLHGGDMAAYSRRCGRFVLCVPYTEGAEFSCVSEAAWRVAWWRLDLRYSVRSTLASSHWPLSPRVSNLLKTIWYTSERHYAYFRTGTDNNQRNDLMVYPMASMDPSRRDR